MDPLNNLEMSFAEVSVSPTGSLSPPLSPDYQSDAFPDNNKYSPTNTTPLNFGATQTETFSNSFGEHPLGEHPSRTLFVRNINSNVEDDELVSLFEVNLFSVHLFIEYSNTVQLGVCTLNANTVDL